MDDTYHPVEAPFQAVLDALLDSETNLDPAYLFRLSDLEGEDATKIKEIWPQIPVWRRRALLEDIEQLADDNFLLSFEYICRVAIDDEDARVRFLAVRPMSMYEPVDLIAQILNMLEADPDENVRAVCASTLGRFVYLGEIDDIPSATKDEVVSCLLRVAKGQDNMDVRRRALEALGYADHKEVPQLIDEAINSNETNWLISALFAMGRTYDSYWSPKVVEMLHHQLPAIRFEATRSAGELGIGEAVPTLLELLEDSDEDVRMAAIWSLSQVGGEGVREALEKQYKEVHSQEEANIIQDALDNLIFNEEMKLFGLLDFSEEEDDLLDY
jgi:HEAT repeat protein